MVTVVGRPAERKLGQITRTYYEPVNCVCGVHKHLGTFPRLRVFVSRVVYTLVMAYVDKVLSYRIGDIYLVQGYSQRSAKLPRVVESPHCRTETGHSECYYLLFVELEHIKRANGDEQSEGRIQTARNAYDGVICVRRAQSRGKPGRLHLEYQVTALSPQVFIGRHKRVCIYGVFGLTGNKLHIKLVQRIIAVCVGKGIHAPAFVQKPFCIYVAYEQLAAEQLCLTEYRAVLSDYVVSGKHQVGSRFATACICVHIAAGKPSRNRFYERPPVFGFAYDLVAGREIEHYNRTFACELYRWRVGDPHVLTYLDTEAEFGHFNAGKELF